MHFEGIIRLRRETLFSTRILMLARVNRRMIIKAISPRIAHHRINIEALKSRIIAWRLALYRVVLMAVLGMRRRPLAA